MANVELKSKNGGRGELLRAWFDFIFGFENKKGDILGHWIAFHDNFSFSPQEFLRFYRKGIRSPQDSGHGDFP